jgi:phosphatidyl-myo-inositol alpha-mannosyltransferase
MRIGLALETTFDSDAGVQQYFKSLGRYLIRKRHDVRFLVTHGSDKGEFKGRIISLGTVFNPPIFNPTSVPFGLYSPMKNISGVLRDFKFDVIHCGIPVSPWSLGKLIRDAECPVVGTFLSHSHDPRNRFWMYFASSILMNTRQYIDILTAPNKITAYDASHIVPGNYHIVPLAIDLSAFKGRIKPIKDLRDGRPTILFFGRLDARKGVRYLVEALPIILKRIPNARLIIAGDGPMRGELELLAGLNNVKDAVDFAGYIPETEKPRYFASADICAFPATHGESFGIVIVEALASGKIPIAFANEGYRSVLENLPETLVTVKKKKELARRLIFYLTHKREKKALEQKCLKEAKRFDWNTVGPQMIRLYQKAIHAKR